MNVIKTGLSITLKNQVQTDGGSGVQKHLSINYSHIIITFRKSKILFDLPKLETKKVEYCG